MIGKSNTKTRRLKLLILSFLAVLLLTPWSVTYAYDASDGVVGEETIRIEAAEASAQPSWTAFGRAVGGVNAGDVFYIDATDNPADIQTTLYLTNTEELRRCYRYMILKVGVYVENNAGEWEKAVQCNGEPTPDTFITLRNCRVSFTLSGCGNYKVTIDRGSFYCTNAKASHDNLSPKFYLTVDQEQENANRTKSTTE